MIFVIDRVLDQHELAAVQAAATALPYGDGRTTSGRFAQAVKRNEQAADTPARAAILAKVRSAVAANPVVQAAAQPRAFARLAISRYTPGMEYGFHVDNAIIDSNRTDLSFTLCLSSAADYQGGELVIDDPLEQRAVRLDAGQLVLYPSNTLHRVAPVTGGTRLAVVGWITSWVADPGRRTVLYDLAVAARAMHAVAGDSPGFLSLQKAQSNLLRMWAGE